MSVRYGSCDGSPLGAFAESPLGARNATELAECGDCIYYAEYALALACTYGGTSGHRLWLLDNYWNRDLPLYYYGIVNVTVGPIQGECCVFADDLNWTDAIYTTEFMCAHPAPPWYACRPLYHIYSPVNGAGSIRVVIITPYEWALAPRSLTRGQAIALAGQNFAGTGGFGWGGAGHTYAGTAVTPPKCHSKPLGVIDFSADFFGYNCGDAAAAGYGDAIIGHA